MGQLFADPGLSRLKLNVVVLIESELKNTGLISNYSSMQKKVVKGAMHSINNVPLDLFVTETVYKQRIVLHLNRIQGLIEYLVVDSVGYPYRVSMGFN